MRSDFHELSSNELDAIGGGRLAVTMPGALTGAQLSPGPIWHGPVLPTGTGPTIPVDPVGPIVV